MFCCHSASERRPAPVRALSSASGPPSPPAPPSCHLLSAPIVPLKRSREASKDSLVAHHCHGCPRSCWAFPSRPVVRPGPPAWWEEQDGPRSPCPVSASGPLTAARDGPRQVTHPPESSFLCKTKAITFPTLPNRDRARRHDPGRGSPGASDLSKSARHVHAPSSYTRPQYRTLPVLGPSQRPALRLVPVRPVESPCLTGPGAAVPCVTPALWSGASARRGCFDQL